MLALKVRVLMGASILTIVSLILLVIKGMSPLLLGLLSVGVVLLIVGVFWKSQKKS